jgi:hypothetical protein
MTQAPSFAADVYPLFQAARCPTCHGSPGSAGLDLSMSVAYNNLVNRPASECMPSRFLVAASAPQSSYLLDKLLGTNLCSGVRMPRGGTPFTQAQLDTVQAWIAAGAAP